MILHRSYDPFPTHFRIGIDSSLSDNFGRSIFYFTSALTTFVTITVVGGPVFFVAAVILGIVYYNIAKVYGQCSRDMRRLGESYRSMKFSIIDNNSQTRYLVHHFIPFMGKLYLEFPSSVPSVRARSLCGTCFAALIQ